MAKKNGPGDGTAADSVSTTENPTVDALKETLKKVEASLLPAVDSFCVGSSTSKNASANDDDDVKLPLPSKRGLDFMHAKNTLLLSYLIDLTVHLRDTADTVVDVDTTDEESKEAENGGAKKKQQQERQRRRLLEMRTVLDKSRGLDKKLRYQIDKLLSSLTDSSAFATGNYGSDDDGSGNIGDNGQDDPLRHRPDPKSMLDSDEDDDSADDDSADGDGNDGDSADDMDEDDDLAAARATLSMSKQAKTKKKKQDDDDDEEDDEDNNGARKKYIAPRLTAVPYTHDVADKRLEKEKRQRRKLRSTELAQTLRQQYGDQPETEDVFGGGNSELYGKQRSASRALAQKEAERTEFEESTMIRLTTSRKDKKEKKRVERMMEGGANLAQIANLGNLVRETEAFGRDDDGNSDDDDQNREEALQSYMTGDQSGNKSSGGGGSRHANGKRRRDPTVENSNANGAGRRLKMGKRPRAKNSVQAALYGSRSGSSTSKGKKKGKR
uniref:Sas10 C-terminal domain-containing protein n=1 Tax=Pseudo-nitzschia australis TaxID=44445 RepID=A0A7S4ADI3_9STRA|mmetsp:Transcript_19983/g.43462  ORF Transcript_19983/g.43462 Transcript_19983/m.43462 type:complete len:497 (-) Transcript_19983:54-1544(-)